jgi:hypothetical protein
MDADIAIIRIHVFTHKLFYGQKFRQPSLEKINFIQIGMMLFVDVDTDIAIIRIHVFTHKLLYGQKFQQPGS